MWICRPRVQSQMDVTPELILGIFGTITGSASLLISWHQWRVDRSVLRLEASILFEQSIAKPRAHLRLRLILKNHGRRLIKVIKVGIVMAENQWQTINGERVFMKNIRLTPPQLHTQELCLDEEGRYDFDLNPFDLDYIQHARKIRSRRLTFYAIDSLDREYRTTIKIPDEKSIVRLERPDKDDKTV